MADKLKSFWDKPEGKTGMIFLAGGIFGFFLIMMKFGAAIVAAAQNTLILGLYTGIAVAIGAVLLNKRFQATVSLGFKSLMRAFTGLVVQIDPIAILKSYIEDLEDSHGKMNTQITKLKQTIRSLRDTITKNIDIAKNQMALAQQAKKTGQQAMMVLKTRKAGRLQDSNRTYQDLLNKVEVLYRVLSKMYENCGILIEDSKDQVEQKEIEWKTIKQANSAMKSAMSIINGDKDKRAVYEQALEYMATDLENKVGEMERFMEMSESFLAGVDLQNGVFEEKGMEMLEKWEKDADSWLLSPDEKKQLVSDSNNPSMNVNLDIPAGIKQSIQHSNQYENLFNQ
jgi:uncharacterized membrane protein YgaE (UPF0421/DUF939 family)